MMLRQLLLVGALVATAAPVYAQQPAKSGADFAATVASSDMFEIKSSELALEAASSNEVKSFARQMITDHTKSSDRLKAAAKADKVDVPAKPDRKHAAMLTTLEGKKGDDFDKAYVAAQTKAHDEAVELFTAYSEGGDKPSIKAFAAETLPTLKMHQDHAKKLQSEAM